MQNADFTGIYFSKRFLWCIRFSIHLSVLQNKLKSWWQLPNANRHTYTYKQQAHKSRRKFTEQKCHIERKNCKNLKWVESKARNEYAKETSQEVTTERQKRRKTNGKQPDSQASFVHVLLYSRSSKRTDSFFLLSALEWKLRARNMNGNWTLVFVNIECARPTMWIGNYALFTNCSETFDWIRIYTAAFSGPFSWTYTN